MLLAESIVLWTLNLVIASTSVITLSLVLSYLFRSLPKRHASLVGGITGILAAPLLVAVTWAFSLGQISSPFPQQNVAVELFDSQLVVASSSVKPIPNDFQAEQGNQQPTVQPTPGTSPLPQTISVQHDHVPSTESAELGSAKTPEASIEHNNQISRPEPLQLSWFQTLIILGAIIWITGIAVCAAVAVHDLLRCSRILRCCHAVDSQRVKSALARAIEESGIGRDVPVLIAKGLPAPVVIGFSQPSILLPEETQVLFSDSQLHAVLMHELSHVKRKDHLVVYLTAIAKVLYWWNPVVYLASQRISELREMICDDIAARVADEPSEYALTIVNLAERAFAKNAGWIPLGIGQSSVNELEMRVKRILADCGDLIETNLSSRFRLIASVCACLLFGTVAFAQISGPNATETKPASGETKPALDEAKTAGAIAPKKEEAKADNQMRRFTLIVVDPNKSPVPNANVEVRGISDFKEEWIIEGKDFKQASYGVKFTANGEGKVVLQIPINAKPEIFVETKGYAPYYAQWGNNPLPAGLVAELDRAMSIGGVVVNEQGDPIADASIRPSFRFKNRPGDTGALYVGTRIKTDDRGQWHYDFWPEHLHDIYVEVVHPKYKPKISQLSASLYSSKDGTAAPQRIVMDKGLTVKGRVTNAQGAPIEGAILNAKFNNDVREAKTNAEGFYELGGCDEIVSKVVVSASKMATDMQTVQITKDMKDVNFVMQPGGHVRIRALDENGKAIPKTRIFPQRWRDSRFNYFEFDHVSQYANEEGVWEWNEAPLDEFKADICPPGRMTLGAQPILARPEEYVFTTTVPLSVTGKVIDADTNEPIKDFEVIPGVRSGPDHMNWVPYEIFKGANGQFTYSESHDYFAHLFKVQANGYLAEESRDIKSNEGAVEVVFKLKRGADIKLQVLSPDGKPAIGAKVALGLPGAQINVDNGDITDGSTYAERTTTDASGIFTFPAQSSEYQLVITHEAGYAFLQSAKMTPADSVTLTAWAKLTGVYRSAGKAIPGIQLYLDSGNVHSYGPNTASIFTSSYIVTGADGRFSLDRVFPGEGSIQRYILRMVGEGAKEVTSTERRRIMFEAGKTTEIEYSGKGASVHGHLLAPTNFVGQPLWTFIDVDLEPDLPKEPAPIPNEIKGDDAKVNAWYVDWFKTPQGKTWQVKSSAIYEQERKLNSYNATVDEKGNFTLLDVVAGSYRLRVRPSPEKRIGNFLNGISVSISNEQESSSASIQVGDIQLTP